MYLPRAFAESDLAHLDALIAADPFVTLVSTAEDGAPYASNVPVLYRRDGDNVLVEGHWARPNAQCRHEGPVLMIAQGPHAYVSPAWYPDKETQARVPTWNYAVAHLHGLLERFEDEPGLSDLVSRLSDRFEALVGSDWKFEPAREDHRSQLRGIVGFRFVPRRIELKFKQAVTQALQRQDNVGAHAIADLMRVRD
jgi:transcriptional regulator